MECYLRQSKQLQSNLTCVKVEVSEKKKESDDSNNPSVSFHVSESDWCWDPLLDMCHPTPPPPLPYQTGGPNPMPSGAHVVRPDTRRTQEQLDAAAEAARVHPPNPFIPPSQPNPFTPNLQSSFADPASWTGLAGHARDFLSPGPPQPEFDSALSEASALPMIQVPDPDGDPHLVYWPWTDAEVCAAITHLLPASASGAAFSAEFKIFCGQFMPTGTEIRRILMKNWVPLTSASVRWRP